MIKKEYRKYLIHKKNNNELGFIALIRRSKPINLITGPIIYAMIFPIIFLDIFVWFYQFACFPLYKLEKFNRSQYIIFDRQELKYLDWISKFHCSYCAYAVGVINLVGAIIERTESYFCPIKHKLKRSNKEKEIKYLNFENNDDFDYDNELFEIREKITKK